MKATDSLITPASKGPPHFQWKSTERRIRKWNTNLINWNQINFYDMEQRKHFSDSGFLDWNLSDLDRFNQKSCLTNGKLELKNGFAEFDLLLRCLITALNVGKYQMTLLFSIVYNWMASLGYQLKTHLQRCFYFLTNAYNLLFK